MATPVNPLEIVIKYFTIICLILAALLLIWPGVFVKLNLLCKTWFSTVKLERELNRTRDIDAQLLGMRKILGIACLALALIFILTLLKL
jgi:hypothetical protein